MRVDFCLFRTCKEIWVECKLQVTLFDDAKHLTSVHSVAGRFTSAPSG